MKVSFMNLFPAIDLCASAAQMYNMSQEHSTHTSNPYIDHLGTALSLADLFHDKLTLPEPAYSSLESHVFTFAASAFLGVAINTIFLSSTPLISKATCQWAGFSTLLNKINDIKSKTNDVEIEILPKDPNDLKRLTPAIANIFINTLLLAHSRRPLFNILNIGINVFRLSSGLQNRVKYLYEEAHLKVTLLFHHNFTLNGILEAFYHQDANGETRYFPQSSENSQNLIGRSVKVSYEYPLKRVPTKEDDQECMICSDEVVKEKYPLCSDSKHSMGILCLTSLLTLPEKPTIPNIKVQIDPNNPSLNQIESEQNSTVSCPMCREHTPLKNKEFSLQYTPNYARKLLLDQTKLHINKTIDNYLETIEADRTTIETSQDPSFFNSPSTNLMRLVQSLHFLAGFFPLQEEQKTKSINTINFVISQPVLICHSTFKQDLLEIKKYLTSSTGNQLPPMITPMTFLYPNEALEFIETCKETIKNHPDPTNFKVIAENLITLTQKSYLLAHLPLNEDHKSRLLSVIVFFENQPILNFIPAIKQSIDNIKQHLTDPQSFEIIPLASPITFNIPAPSTILINNSINKID
jgi:hypothetical protein